MVKLIKFIIIGIIQGVTEVLPVSSSGHLILTQYFLKLDDIGLSFIVFLHIASLIAVIFFMRKTLLKLIKSCYYYVFKKDIKYKNDFKYVLYLLISSIPIAIIGPLVSKYINISSILVIGILLIINGIMLLFLSRLKGNKSIEEMNYKDALTIGAFQCIGLLPGISRSGSCLCGSFVRKINKEDAANYIFLMFIPAVLGAIIFDIQDINLLFTSNDLIFYIISFFVTLFVTYFSFKILLKFIRKGKLDYFSYYCFIIGLGVIIYSSFN